MSKRVLIAGGGAAGCFGAIRAAKAGASVLLLEGGGDICRKLAITGKGRCNLTNACDTRTILENTPRNARFLYSALTAFGAEDVMRFFENEGVPLKVERGRRVFPKSDRAEDITNALRNALARENVRIRLNTRVTEILKSPTRLLGVRCADGTEYRADALLLATGGMSYPQTGSTGDGYELAKAAGHSIEPPRPSLIPLEVAQADECAQMQGLALKNVTLTVTRGKKTVFSRQGELLFTHFGVSGPLVLTASAFLEPDAVREYELSIDCKPALTPQQLDARVLRDLSGEQNRDMHNVLRKLLPASMVPVILARAGIAEDTKAHDLTKEARSDLVRTVKAFTLRPTRTRPITEAVITRGGVSVREVSPKTMESRLVRGLYFAGELLDVDALTGGYNLQIAFSTAAAAAKAMAE